MTLAANVSIHNPRGYRTWHCNRMETANSPPEMPTREFWYSRMVRHPPTPLACACCSSSCLTLTLTLPFFQTLAPTHKCLFLILAGV